MTKKIFITTIMAAIIVAACGTVRLPGVPGVGGTGNVRARATRTPAPTVGALDPSASTQTAFTPIPTYDVVSKLVTQAYALYTPTPGSAATKATAVATAAPSNTGAVDPAPTASGGVIIVPSSVIVNETVIFANFTNTATCGIKLIGDCTTLMKPNQDIYMTWKFTNNTTRTFTYGDAMVTIVRDGQTFANMQTINGATRIQPPDKDAKWELKVGDTAEFRAGVDKIQAGSYNARLMICTNVPADCRAGNGWQRVGGNYVNFTVAP